ncbi:hypothetical protein SETIT_7G258900v2 [Setaria italica]|uniref:Uncharacterized protein n=1 Tax=Setaria italica TaxID=4555 RepID=A0A368RZN9_SETIT|nr:hypothetical protein SETIT_7G258900v2 [Setaria italica]
MPFREDIEKIEEYEKAMTSRNTSIFHIEATTFSLYLCMIAATGVRLAAKVMNNAGFRLDKHDGISPYTTKQTLMMYVSIFVKLAKDTHDKKFNDESNFSLLGAFRGVAAVGHILLQDAVENANNAAYSYSFAREADDAWCDFEQKMYSLEERFRAVSKSNKAYEILMRTMVDAMILAMFFISEVVLARTTVLIGTKGRCAIRASDDGEPNASGTSFGKDGAD